jgi:hypothetical protein
MQKKSQKWVVSRKVVIIFCYLFIKFLLLFASFCYVLHKLKHTDSLLTFVDTSYFSSLLTRFGVVANPPQPTTLDFF